MSFRPCCMPLLAVVLLSLLSLHHLPLSHGQSTAPVGPVITSLSDCPLSPADNSTLLCSPPFSVTVWGSGLALTDVLNISNYVVTSPLTVAADGSSAVFYVADAGYYPVMYNVNLPVSVIDLSTHATSNTLYNLQMVAQQPVLLSSISGCEGSGAVTNNCDLSSSVVTIRGSGFLYDRTRWYLLFGASTVQYLVTDYSGSPTYSLGGDTIVLPLNYTLVVLPNIIEPTTATSGTMSVCFTHGNTASNCLALSYSYAPPNSSPPTVTPTAGFTTNSSLAVLSVTGCGTVYANGSTSDCSTTSGSWRQLTLVGSGFPPASRLYITIGAVRCTSAYLDTNNTRLTCYIPNEFTALQMNQWLPVTVIDTIALQQGPPAYLVQFNEPPYPTVTSISGCSGDGINGSLTTSGCHVSSTVTIVGSGFVADGPRWAVSVGVAGTALSNTRTIISAYVVDANTIELPASLLYTLIGSSVTTVSTTLSVYLLRGSQLVGPIVVTITTPPLSVNRVSGCAAASTTNLTVSGCNPGVSVITIQGVSFSSVMTVTVAGQPCVLTSITSTSLQCVLPLPWGVQHGVGYDLYIGNFAGNVTIPGAVSYTSNPTIVSVTSPFCPPDFAWTNTYPTPLYCTAYSQLTLTGVYFQDLSTLTVNISTGSTFQPSLTCGNLSYLSSNELTCTLPAPPTTQYAQIRPHYIQIWENATFASNSFPTVLYTNTVQQPNLVSVSGCASVDAATRVASGCQVGDVITLNGANFVAGSGTAMTQVHLWSDGDVFQCSAPRVLSLTQLTCILPYLPLLAVDSVVPVRIGYMNGMQSNWLVAINFNVAAGQSSGSSDAKFIISLAVLIPLVAVLLVLLAGVLVMKRSGGGSGKRYESEGQPGRSQQGWSRQNDEKEESGLQMSGVSVDTYSNPQ